MNFIMKFFQAIGTVIQYSCITHCVLEYVGDFIVCTGPSMEPTVNSKDVLFTEHISHRLNKLKKGDIIIAKCPTNPHQHICKRIIAVEGDKIRYGFRKYVVPEGHLWLEGDNRDNSTDSRLYGPVPQGLIRSRAVCKVWPLKKLTTQSDDFSRKLYIFAEKSQRYICFNKRWKPVALPKKQRDAMCQFYETYNGPYLRYRSAVDSSKYLGFNKYGKPIKGQRGRAECFNFMKFNPSFSINDHNDWMTGNTDHKKRDLIHRKHQQIHDHQYQHHQLGLVRKRNYLQADQVPRELTTQHRHRHTNRLKHDDLLHTSPRRRHPTHLTDLSKY